MSELVRLLPDVGDRLTRMTVVVEELLRTLAVREVDLWRPLALPAPLAGSVALNAFVRVSDAVLATQTRVGYLGHLHRPAAAGAGARWSSADGQRDLVPLYRARIDGRDLELLHSAARTLGLALAVGADPALADAVREVCRAVGIEPPDDEHAPVAMLARIVGVLDLEPSDDGLALLQLMAQTSGRSDVVLQPRLEASHRRVLDRITSMLGA